MARRGTFGRLPRAAPDLTNTLVALIREAAAQEDSNYVDAWKNGGKVEGSGVSDEDLLEHFKKRRDQLDPLDPAWDEWNNRVAQYDFSINESKMSLKYDQKKVSEQEVSDFYKKWVSRPEIQQDSEFYRELLSKQAKWHTAAVQGAAARGASNRYENHQKWAAGVEKSQTQPAKDAHSYILQIAKAYNAAPEGATSLEDVYETSTGWGRVLDIIDDGKSDDPNIQKMLDEATRLIRSSPGNEDFVFDKSHLTALDHKADSGYGTLKKNSMNKSERDHWGKEDGKHKFESTRVRQAEASARIGLAADEWANALDDCNGNPYCARNATKTYRDTLAREGKHLLAGQGEVTLATQDNAQARMLVSTMRTLDIAIKGDPVEATGASGLSGVAGAGIEETQVDVIARGGKSGDMTPENIIGGYSNIFNDQIKKLDAGGWVSNDPQFDPRTNDVLRDGNGDPIYAFTVHGANEVPTPGLFEVPAITSFTDETQTGPAAGPEGASGPKTVQPRQFVRAEPPPVVATTEGGDPVDPKNLTPTDAKGQPLAAPPAGYMVVKVIGPDGNLQTLYRTGSGAVGDGFLLHTEPPVLPESAGGPKMTTVGGVKVPVFTAKPGQNAKGEGILTYDTTPVTNGIATARTKNPASGRLPLGTYENIGSAATAKSINDVFNKGGATAEATATATKLWQDYSRNITGLPPAEQAKYAGDLFQLGQTVSLRSRGITQANLDGEYKTLNDRTPQQDLYRQQLEGRGLNDMTIGADEMGRRVSLLEDLDRAEQRLARRPNYGGYSSVSTRMQDALNGQDAETIAQSRKDIFNPTISVSNIKVPGAPAMMQPTSLEEQARLAGIRAGMPFGGGAGNFDPALTPFPAPKAPVHPGLGGSGVIPHGGITPPETTFTPPKVNPKEDEEPPGTPPSLATPNLGGPVLTNTGKKIARSTSTPELYDPSKDYRRSGSR